MLAGDQIEFRKCLACGVVFRVPLLLPADLEQYFANSYITTQESLADNFGTRREEILSLCAASIRRRTRGGAILDVGCAGGYFLNRFFQDEHWTRHGIEPSHLAAHSAACTGIHVYHGQVSTVALPENFFDVITLFDVLYYFADPASELQILRRSMNSNGLLLIEVPLAVTQLLRHNSRPGRILGGHPVSPLERRHNFLFSPKSLVSLLTRCGFHVQQVAPLPGVRQPGTLQHIVHRSYYSASRVLGKLSAGKLMAGPNCLVIATLDSSRG